MSPRRPKLVSLSILVILLLSVSAVFVLSLTPASHSVVSAYSPRAPIIIDNDTDFAAQALAESWPGTGMVGNPYVIAGYQIDGTGHDYGVYIGNTTVRFVLSDCLVVNNAPPSTCIELRNVTNGILENNNCSGAVYGISLDYSSNNTLSINNCSNCDDGIIFHYSNNNTVTDNNCSNDNWDALSIFNSDNNTLANNTCSHSVNYGIALVECNNNTLVNNTCSFNYIGMMLEWPSNGNTVISNNISSNTLWGLSISSETSNSRIWNNTFYYNNGAGSVYDSSHIQASDDGTNNWWNSTDGHGNYWSDWTTPDTDLNGIVDDPYLLAGSAGAKDYYPRATPQQPIPEFGTLALVAMVLLMAIVLTMGSRRRRTL